MEQFDALYVVSDLHLGGSNGHQIFCGTRLLSGIIEKLTLEESERRIAFVINGDFVDFLAESGATYFDPAGAADKLTRISRDPSFAPIWQALGRFVATRNRTLAVVLGNHDIELALPRVQETLLELICGGQESSRGRVRLQTLGTGFAARVGALRVLCLHGNECDTFNITDYETLRRAARDQTYGFAPKVWVPNAGTKLVIELMNEIKGKLPFIDLLKPETDAVVPLLVAMGQVNPERLVDVFQVAARTITTGVKHRFGLLSTSGDTIPTTGDALTNIAELQLQSMAQARVLETISTLESTSQSNNSRSRSHDTMRDHLMDEIECKFEAGEDPSALEFDGMYTTLGLGNLIGAAWRATISAISGGGETETVRRALQHVIADRSFDLSYRDETFKGIDALVPSDIEVLVTGHTHLERFHPRSSGTQYMNSGTWARLIHIDPDTLNDPTRFDALYAAIKSNRLEDLVDAKYPDGLPVVQHRPTVASIEANPSGVQVELRHVHEDGGIVTMKGVAQ